MLPVLDKVRLLAIDDRGVLLSGIEMHPARGLKGSRPMYDQVWWCVTKNVPPRHVPTLGEAEEREARERGREIGRTMVGGHERYRR